MEDRKNESSDTTEGQTLRDAQKVINILRLDDKVIIGSTKEEQIDKLIDDAKGNSDVAGMFAIGSCGSDGIALHQRRRAGAVDEGREGSEGDEASQKSSSSEEGDVAEHLRGSAAAQKQCGVRSDDTS